MVSLLPRVGTAGTEAGACSIWTKLGAGRSTTSPSARGTGFWVLSIASIPARFRITSAYKEVAGFRRWPGFDGEGKPAGQVRITDLSRVRLLREGRLVRVGLISYRSSPLAALGSSSAGGMNVYVRRLAEGLAERGVEVDIFTRREDLDSPKEL